MCVVCVFVYMFCVCVCGCMYVRMFVHVHERVMCQRVSMCTCYILRLMVKKESEYVQRNNNPTIYTHGWKGW